MPVLHVEITRMLLMPFNVGEHMNYKETTFEADLRFESVYVQKAYACVPMGLARQSLDARAGLSRVAATRAHAIARRPCL